MIKKHDSSDEYYFEEGCHIVETSNSVDDEDVSIARARVEKGQTTKWHYLENTIERYVILSGCGLVEIGTQAACEITTGDVVIIPANTRQRIKITLSFIIPQPNPFTFNKGDWQLRIRIHQIRHRTILSFFRSEMQYGGNNRRCL